MSTATVLRPGTTDKFGDSQPGTEFDVEGCLLLPRTSSENDDYATTVISTWTLYAPVAADIRARDHVRVNGVVYDVQADPARWSDPAAPGQSTAEIVLTRTRG